VVTATANAQLIGMEVSTAPPVVFDPLLNPGQAVAQAEIDSLGSSKGFALTFTPQGARPESCYFVTQGNGQGSYTTPVGSGAQC